MDDTTTLAEFVKALPSEKKDVLVDTFFRIWSTNGFGTMTKKDTELLLFRCLADLLGDHAPQTNYDWAHLLRVTPKKVKALRLESHLRFGHLFAGGAAASQSARYFGELHKTALVLDDATGESPFRGAMVSFVIEDPVAEMELENDLKSVGSYLDFHRNREVVTLRFDDFLRIVRLHAPESEQKLIDSILGATLSDASQAAALRSRLNSKAYAAKSETGKLLAFIELLGGTFAAKPTALMKHLALILQSQKEKD